LDEVEMAHGGSGWGTGADRERGRRGPPSGKNRAAPAGQRAPVTRNRLTSSVWLLSDTREPPRWTNCCM
jgi:hypothetical protein